MFRRLLILITLASAFFESVLAQTSDSIYCTDSESIGRCPACCDSHTFKWNKLILPGALIAIGTIGTNDAIGKNVNTPVKETMDKWRGNNYFRVDDYLQYMPAAAYLCMDFCGIKARHSFKERLMVGATAYLTLAAVVNITKFSVGEMRPDTEMRNSFPSGHTATAFTGAELVRAEYGLWPGISAYTVATAIAFLRLYNGRHWLNDVVAGAGVGILSARVGYWMLPLYRRWLGWDDGNKMMAFSPSYNYVDRSFSIGLHIQF